MSHYDSKVSEELGAVFVDVKMQDTATYRKFRHILMKQYPNKEGMGWPTYIVVNDLDNDYSILGEVKGGHQKGDFRKLLQEIISK